MVIDQTAQRSGSGPRPAHSGTCLCISRGRKPIGPTLPILRKPSLVRVCGVLRSPQVREIATVPGTRFRLDASNERRHVLRRRGGKNTVAEVEDMAWFRPCRVEDGASLALDDLRVRQQHLWIKVTLQRDPPSDARTRIADVRGPVQPDCRTTGIGNALYPLAATFREHDNRCSRFVAAAKLGDDSLDIRE